MATGCRAHEVAPAGSGTGRSIPGNRLDEHERERARDELLADLTDQSARFEPISARERRARRGRLTAMLGAFQLDALLVEPGATMEYLTGVSWGRSERLFGLVVCADGAVLWVTPAFERPRAELLLAAAEVKVDELISWDEHEYAFRPLAASLAARNMTRVAVDPMARNFIPQRLGDALGRPVVSGADVVKELRGRKDEHEQALLRAANELTQLAIRTVAQRIEPGTTDRELGALIRRAQERLGLRGTWVLPLIGDNAAYPHGSPRGDVLAPGDLILVDTGGALHGYQSDNTRTWIFEGKPDAELQRGWNTVRDAQKRAFDAMRPGVRCGDIDRVARDTIERAGYGAGYTAFAHRLGHGIGLEGHEEPYLDGGNDLALAADMTFSDEPGIYLPGRFGIRLEDIVVVTDTGADHFGDWQTSPLAP